ncbi:hypothetical protein [Akkermansia sp.]|uniref:hypothetical protein n=1 Tax=Akkermansia sp. TaxID=1872421 RepID=UPI002673D3A7|nr:hypothetical protein [Akkermansia sp.]MEE0765108.1 hypothetical protein [Akkermansia sp.]
MKLAFEASWNRGGKMLIFIKVIGKDDQSWNISQVTKSDIDRGHTAISEERMTILNKREKRVNVYSKNWGVY